MRKILLTVIIPTYNHENFISECLDSILNQKTSFNYDIVLGEDGSEDSTAIKCKEYACKYSHKIKLFLRDRNDPDYKQNQSTGRNNFVKSYKEAIGKYIAICEGDDYWIDPLKLQKQVDFLEANPSHSFCWTRFKTLDQNTQELNLDLNSKHFFNDEEVIDFDFQTSLKGWHMGTQTLVFRKDYFDVEVHKKFKYFKDVHIIAQLLKKGKGACLNFVGAVYRKHDGGVHTSVTPYNGYKIGYLTHKEIYLDNPKNPYLRQKYNLSFINFTNANIGEGKLLKAVVMSFRLWWFNKNSTLFLKHLKRIALKFTK